jgi:signal transduction histidine kinase
VVVTSIDDRIHEVLRRLPRILRSDRAPSAVLGEVATLTRELFGTHLAVAAFLDDDRSLGAMGFSGASALDEPALRQHPAITEALATLLTVDAPVRVDTPPGNVASTTTMPRPRPVIGSLLGVRLRSGSRTVGVLFLATDKDGTFAAQDERLLEELGRALGAALDNAMLLREALRARRWMRAATTLTQQLLANELPEPLKVIAERAMELADATVCAVLLVQDDNLVVRHVTGLSHLAAFRGRAFPLDGSITQRVLDAGEPINFPDLADEPSDALRGVDDSELGPGVMIPLHGEDELVGTLFLGRYKDSPMFTHAELDMASAFASQASIALELVAARKLQDALLLVEERDRIARDLHDHVVQRLFATGLSLQQAVPNLEGAGKERVESAMISIDETIRQIRNTILTLRSAGDDAVTLVDMITDIAMEAERLLGFAPILALDPGSRDIRGPLAADLAACVREAISNVVRHARATQVIVKAVVHLGQLTLSVSDDGVGIASSRRSGLGNLAKRAEQHGGFLECDSTVGHGTTLTWRVPVVRL